MPHDLWQLRQEWEVQWDTGNLLWTGLYVAEKTKKQSLAMNEESCLCLKQECSLESQEYSGRLLPSASHQGSWAHEQTRTGCFASGRRGISRLTVGLIQEKLSPVQQLSPSSWALLTEQSLLEAQEGYGLVSREVGWPVLKRQHLLRCNSPAYHARRTHSGGYMWFRWCIRKVI